MGMAMDRDIDMDTDVEMDMDTETDMEMGMHGTNNWHACIILFFNTKINISMLTEEFFFYAANHFMEIKGDA